MALEQRLGERVCVLQWTNLTTCDVSTSPEALICQIHARQIKGFVDDGPDVCVRCGGKDKYKNKSKITFLNGRWPKNSHDLWLGSVIQVQVCRHLHRHVMASKLR